MQKTSFIVKLALFFLIGIPFDALTQPPANGPKIFQIGFHRCGTTSLSRLFQGNDIRVVHWGKGVPALSIHRNYLMGLPLLDQKYKDIVVFLDLECHLQKIYIGQQLFKELDSQYPGSKFILNTRSKKNWLKSRVSHRGGLYLEECAQAYGLSLSEMFFQWSQEWDQHHADVLEYFKDRPDDLIIFDIEKDPISKRQSLN